MPQICPLCLEDGGEVIYRTELYRLIAVNELTYPGFIRLVLNQHVQEMTDLSAEAAWQIFNVLLKVESAIRDIYQPVKINLASLGNLVPHLHWHIIPRYYHDKHFPNSIWGEVTHPNYTPSAELISKLPELINRLNSSF